MARNSYLGLARLGTHPAFTWDACTLVCRWPGCEQQFARVGEYDRHFLAHKPDARMAYRWLSGRTYDREASKQGWPPGPEALAKFGDDTV